jgi:hypothetical protein
MPLQQAVEKALSDAGKQLRQDLWSKDDLVVLAQRAKDLVGLELKAKDATSATKKDQYQLAARLVVQHVQLLALTRINVAEKHVLDALGRFFTSVLLPELLKLLPALFA